MALRGPKVRNIHTGHKRTTHERRHTRPQDMGFILCPRPAPPRLLLGTACPFPLRRQRPPSPNSRAWLWHGAPRSCSGLHMASQCCSHGPPRNPPKPSPQRRAQQNNFGDPRRKRRSRGSDMGWYRQARYRSALYQGESLPGTKIPSSPSLLASHSLTYIAHHRRRPPLRR